MTSPGTVLDGRYRLVRRLGHGTMGTVWEAADPVLERTVAVKEMHVEGADPAAFAIRRERARREAIALARVDHPVIVDVLDVLDGDEIPWIVMRYVRGRQLHDLIRPRLPERDIAAIGLAVLEGLRACHASGVCHRDVKPANILVGDDAAVRLVDFGLARIASLAALTVDGHVPGTVPFLAPELFSGEQASPDTDLWALGVTLYTALAGHLPFRAGNDAETVHAIQFHHPPEPREGGPLARLVLAMLRKRPEDRPDAASIENTLRGAAVQPFLASRRAAGPGPADPAARPGLGPRPAALAGLSIPVQRHAVQGMPTQAAAAELLALPERDAASIIRHCGDALGGNLLSALARPGGNPGTARKILRMLLPEQQERLIRHMSSGALAALLNAPAADAARLARRAGPEALAGALALLPPDRAASLLARAGRDISTNDLIAG